MKDNSVLARIPLLRWLLQPARIPLLFSVTIVSGIFYHYAPEFTAFWIVLSLCCRHRCSGCLISQKSIR